jgi:hypothetical protein
MNELHATGLFSRDATAKLIAAGKCLVLAGEERLLTGLPPGEWIGGTTAWFMTSGGGMHSADAIFVTEMPVGARVTIKQYDAVELKGLANDHPAHGFTVLLLPAFTEVHKLFAENAPTHPDVFDQPLVGWIAGVVREEIGTVTPKIFNGLTANGSDHEAVAMIVELPGHRTVTVHTINLFHSGDGDMINFPAAGFSAQQALINGEPIDFAHYLTDRGADLRLPLVADYNGAMINVSIRSLDAEKVEFYAPVFPNIDYHLAAPVHDYVASFNAKLRPDGPAPVFACNCILNYRYADLSRATLRVTGPMAFGEIAYLVLNQTAVYLTITSDES